MSLSKNNCVQGRLLNDKSPPFIKCIYQTNLILCSILMTNRNVSAMIRVNGAALNWIWNWKLLAVYIMLSWILVFSYRHSLGLTTSSQRQRDDGTMMGITMTMTTTIQSHSQQRNHHIKLTKWVCEYVCVCASHPIDGTHFSLYI